MGWKCSNPNCRKITRGAGTEKTDGDKEIIKFFVQCFDRPAFHDKIYQEGSMEDFDKAIEDTIIALNTGILRARDGSILKQSEGF